MGHKTGFLSGTEPGEKEEKTEAQKNDERLPEAMKQSKIIDTRYSDSNELPAIEQVFEHHEMQAAKRAGKIFNIDKNFEREIHSRSQAEHEAREKARKQQARTEKEKEEAKAAEIAEKIQHSQSLNPEEIEHINIEKERKENAEKLYPDPISMQSEVEEALWRKRTDKGDQIAKRARLEDVYDDKLHNGIIKSFIFQILGVALVIIPIFFGGTFSRIVELLLMSAGTVGFIFSIITLRQATEKYRNKHLPHNQEATFTLASVVPFVALRSLLFSILSYPLGIIPFIGAYLAIIIGVVIGSSIHYLFLFKYFINPTAKIVLLNTLAFFFSYIFPTIIAISNNPNPNAFDIINIYGQLPLIGIFMGCDYITAKMSPGHFS